MTEELQKILNKISSRLDELTDKKIDYSPEDYHKCWALSGAGIGAGEWEYDEDKAREDVIEDQEWWQEDEEMTNLIKELLWRL